MSSTAQIKMVGQGFFIVSSDVKEKIKPMNPKCSKWVSPMPAIRRLLGSSGICALVICCASWAVNSPSSDDQKNLVSNPDFRQHAGKQPVGYQINGSAEFRNLGDSRNVADWGVALKSTGISGAVTQTVNGIEWSNGRWYRFTFRGLPERNFTVTDDALNMKVEFYGSDGTITYDAKARQIYPLVQKARTDLTVNGVRHQNGAEVWRTYQLDFVLPFPQVHQLKLSAGFDHGAATAARDSEFLVTDFSLVKIPESPSIDAITRTNKAVVPVYEQLLPLGGHWFYAANSDETSPPVKFGNRNADRLLYHDAGYSAPFAGNCTAWLLKGDRDSSGKVATADRLIEDNVTITFDSTSLIMHTHGLPNHPTGLFPGLNPSYITEQNSTYYIPLNPTENAKHIITTTDNSNHALPMGPIGVALNGVVFFNPFDANSEDAADLMDRCCGHPNPFGTYHYHKYPICLNSPWADEGAEHSPLIGFAFDGYPVYGPYESKDVMAKDVTGEHALNGFNIHYDAERGWHYHVTPGQFPYIIGGYWGNEDNRNKQRGPRGGSGGGPGMMRGGNGPAGAGPPPGRFGPPPGGP
jgi:hypothetical protein